MSFKLSGSGGTSWRTHFFSFKRRGIQEGGLRNGNARGVSEWGFFLEAFGDICANIDVAARLCGIYLQQLREMIISFVRTHLPHTLGLQSRPLVMLPNARKRHWMEDILSPLYHRSDKIHPFLTLCYWSCTPGVSVLGRSYGVQLTSFPPSKDARTHLSHEACSV